MTATSEPMHPDDPRYVYVPRGDTCLMCLSPKGEWHNHPTCADCGAFVHERCPWSLAPRDCGRPFKRYLRPDLVYSGGATARSSPV